MATRDFRRIELTMKTATRLQRLRSFACRTRWSDHETLINARSPGKAKSEFLRSLDCDWVNFVDVHVRLYGEMFTSPELRRVADYRGVAFVCAGMRVKVGNDFGVIVGANSSANLDVLFDADGRYGEEVMNCHPHSQITYFDNHGEIIKAFVDDEALLAKETR